jgi:mRNA interferase RelE/StbE
MWKITYEKQPEKFLKKSDKKIKIRILKYLQQVIENPRLFGKALTAGMGGLWRYRVGDYRIICELKDREFTVLVIDIGHRSEVYKDK